MSGSTGRQVLLHRLALGLLALALGACAGGMPVIGKQGRANAFEDATRSYGKMLRWGYYDEAARYLRAPDGTPLEADMARIARYRITSYDVASQLVADTGREGRVLAVIGYYEIDSGVLQQLRDEQYWWFDREREQWFLGTGLPAFGERAD